MTEVAKTVARRSTFCVFMVLLSLPSYAQLVDKHRMPNTANEGITRSLAEEIGPGAGLQNDARFLDVHHQARSVSCHSPRPATIPAQICESRRAGPGELRRDPS